MSYFIGGFKTNIKAITSFQEILATIVPNRIRNAVLRMESGSSSIISYGANKVIKDILIQDIEKGSWLVLIGTPLVNLSSEQQEQEFLAEFLASPSGSLSNNFDGSFAAFCYDAPKDRFIAASDFNTTIPIFYTLTPDGVFFSSHELSLAKFLNSEIDPFGFSQSIHLGLTWSFHTRFRDIYKMLPCQICVIDENKELHKEHYWHPEQETVWPGDLDDNMEKWLPLLRESVSKFHECSQHKPAIADFTAGEDSRLIVSLCHDLGIPFTAHVAVLDDTETDLIVAKKGAEIAGFDLMERKRYSITEEQLLNNALYISINADAYQGFAKACSEFATNTGSPLDDFSIVKYGGVPGGEAFRGSYYLRGKAVFPSRKSNLDYKFLTKMKYLLDHHPGLMKYSDDTFLKSIDDIVRNSMDEVREFPVGTQIDHMLRIFQTCLTGLKYKNPLYLPFASSQMTRSIYCLSPRFKVGGRLTKACTEILFPELAHVKTQYGVPTIRKTMLRFPLFLPERIPFFKKTYSGAVTRLLKWKDANKWYLSRDMNAYIYTTLFSNPPYSDWFSSPESMITGHLYNHDMLNSILEPAKIGSCRWMPTLGNIVSQELAMRWVYDEGVSQLINK